MPRRGEHPRAYCLAQPPGEPAARAGHRKISRPDRLGVLRDLWFDPSAFTCRALAAELADEWIEYAGDDELGLASAQAHRRAVSSFCATADELLGPGAAAAGLAREQPDLAWVLAEWERTLPARFAPGSKTPGVLACHLRTLVRRRAEHPGRPVAGPLLRLLGGEIGVGWGTYQEIEEFSRADKQMILKAAWRWLAETERRLAQGWRLAGQGQHPGNGSWTDAADLLSGLARQEITLEEIRANLPPFSQWPASLRECIQRPGQRIRPNHARTRLLEYLVRQLYPSDLDLHPFRVLLMAATGHAPEEISVLTEDDVEFFPGGVRLTMIKRRAGMVRSRAFRDNPELPGPAAGTANEFGGRPHRQTAVIVRRLMDMTRAARARCDETGRRHLFTVAVVSHGPRLRFRRWDSHRAEGRFAYWLDTAGIGVHGAPDIRRLRKSVKVEKAIAFGGRVADAADDHHEETFRGHYAQGTTLRVISGKVITTAQQHWLSRAVDGPSVLTDGDDGEPGPVPGLTSREIDDLRRGALDMGVTACRDPYSSPYSPAGQLCAVAPLRCLECRNAWILPSHLPQLLMFSDFLDQLRLRLPPAQFTAVWGQAFVNLRAVVDERSEEEIALARKAIDAGEVPFHLPLAADVEFTP